MSDNKVWLLYDSRYTTNPEDAVLYEACNSLREAKENSTDYGSGTGIVIVEAEIKGGYIVNTKII